MFAELFTKNGLIIADYSDQYSIPYFDRYLVYFSSKKSLETLFVPYQALFHRAFTYDWDLPDSIPDPNSHFLSGIVFLHNHEGFDIVINGSDCLGSAITYRDNGDLFIDIDIKSDRYALLSLERFIYENRSEPVNMWIQLNDPIYDKLIQSGWQCSGDVKYGKKNAILHRVIKKY